MQFEGSIGAVVPQLVFVSRISFRGHNNALDFFQYIDLDIFGIFNRICRDMEDRLIKL